MHPLMESSYSYLNMDLRKEILYDSLSLEHRISIFLAKLLSIEDYKVSMSFGYTSKALSFNQKMILLIDLGALDKAVIKKFSKFMEIRNKFMHNLDIKSFEECDDTFPDNELKKFLLRNYPQEQNGSIEMQLHHAFRQLNTEIIQITNTLFDKIITKAETETEHEINKCIVESYDKSIENLKSLLDDQIDLFADKNPNVNIDDLKNLGTKIYQSINKKVAEDIRQRNKVKN